MATEQARAAPGWLPACLLLLPAVALVHGPILRHGLLHWDDRVMTVQNPLVQPPVLEGLARAWSTPFMDMYIPVTYSALAGLAAVSRAAGPGAPAGELDPWPCHLASLLVHAANALLVLALLRRLRIGAGAALAGALLFALHPVQVESVAWLSGIKDLLWTGFALLALLLRLREHHALATACFALAFLSKPTAVVVPFLALVIEALVLRRDARASARSLLPWFALALIGMLLTRHFQPAPHVETVPLAARPLVALDALAFHLRQLVLPLGLAPDYGRNPAWLLARPWELVRSGLILALAGLLFRRPWLRAPGLLLLLPLLPVLGLLPFDFQRLSTVADHYLYMGLLGPALALALWLARTPGHLPRAACVLGLLALGARSALQVPVWRDDARLWRHVLTVDPQSFVAHSMLGLVAEHEGRPEEAIDHFRHAIGIEPDDVRSRVGLATNLDVLDRTAEALPHFEEALRRRPDDRIALENHGIALLRLDRPAEAARQFRKALAIRPDSKLARHYLELAERMLRDQTPESRAR